MTVIQRNSVVSIVDGTYLIHLKGEYQTTIAVADRRLAVTVQMTKTEAQELLAGLQEARV